MTIAVLSLVVLAQIALFQFVSAIANRSLILQELRSLDGPAPNRLAEHSRRAPIVRHAPHGAFPPPAAAPAPRRGAPAYAGPCPTARQGRSERTIGACLGR